MSFEKKMKKRGNQKLDAFAKNPYHKETVSHIPLWAKIVVPSLTAVAAAVLIVTVGVLPNMARGNKGNATHIQDSAMAPAEPTAVSSQTKVGNESYAPNPSDPRDNSYPEATMDKSWDERTIVGKYPSFSYDDKDYQIRYMDRSLPIDSKYVGNLLGSLSVKGYDSHKKEEHYIDAQIYLIKNIDKDISLAIKFNDSTDYYAYQNAGYYFESIEDMLTKVSFASEVTIDKASYYDSTKSGTEEVVVVSSQESILSFLNSCKETTNSAYRYQTLYKNNPEYNLDGSSSNVESSKVAISNMITLNVQIPALGIDNGWMIFNSNGTMRVNLFGNTAEFNIGEAKYQEIKSILFSN